jgi:ComF family protein
MFAASALAVARAVVDPLLTVVFPSSCVVCREGLSSPSGGPLCPRCWSCLPRHRDAFCACGLPVPPGVPLPCGRCRRGLSPFEAGASLGPYEGGLRTVIHELKYRGRRRLADRLADGMLGSPAVRRVLADGVVLAPVPLHPRRLRERGFNQSDLIAGALATRAGLALAPALVRRKDTASQSGLSAAERRRNVAGAFVVRRRAAVSGRVVVLVDDVLTTGATARACASALREAGASAVRLLTVARVA